MKAPVAGIGRRILSIADGLLAGEDPGPLAELTLLKGLTHVTIRDAVIARLLGHDVVALALLQDEPVSMSWLHRAPTPAALARALLALDRLLSLAEREPETRDAVCSIRSLLLWLARRPLEASLALTGVRDTYPLAATIAGMLASGYQPLPHVDVDPSDS